MDSQTILNSIPTPLLVAGGGFGIGYAVIKVVKLILKLILVGLGAVILFLIYLSDSGIITINYNKLQTVVYSQVQTTYNSSVTLADHAAKAFGQTGSEHITALGIGFAFGCVYAIRK